MLILIGPCGMAGSSPVAGDLQYYYVGMYWNLSL